MGGGFGYAAVTETLSAILCGWLALPAGLFFESQGCGVWWVSDDSPASEGWLCLFKTLQTVYSQWAVVYSQGTTVRWS